MSLSVVVEPLVVLRAVLLVLRSVLLRSLGTWALIELSRLVEPLALPCAVDEPAALSRLLIEPLVLPWLLIEPLALGWLFKVRGVPSAGACVRLSGLMEPPVLGRLLVDGLALSFVLVESLGRLCAVIG